MRLQVHDETTPRKINPKLAMALILTLSFTVYLLSSSSPTFSLSSLRQLYTTNTTRLDTVSTYCTVSQTIQQSDRDTNQQYNSAMSTYFKANSTELVTNLVNGDIDGVSKEIQINGAGTIVFILPFIIGLAVTALIWPCLLCCCVCPQSCPPQCCRDKNPVYSHGELVCPTIFVIMLSLILAATAIPAMTDSSSFFSLFNCEMSKFIDNFYHGNATNNEKYFFSGITMVRSQLTDVLSPKLTQVDTHVSKLKAAATSTMDTAQSHASNALTAMQTLPNGANTAALVLSYDYPIQDAVATGSLASSVAAKIDTYTNSSSLLGTLYSFVSTLNTNLTEISTAATTVSPHLTAADMGAQITVTDTVLGTVQDQLDSINQKLKSVMILLANIDSFTSEYQIILYGIILGVALLILTGIIFVKCLDIYGCRYFLCALCVIALFLCLITFLLTVILALLAPSFYYTCDYFEGKFDSPSAFTTMMTTLQGSEYNDLVNNFAECFGGTNDFMTVLNPTLSNYITLLQTAVHNSKQYDFTAMTTDINSHVSNLGDAIDDAGFGNVPDFDTSSTEGSAEISYFNQVAQKSLYTSSCPESSYSVFYTDVWVPGVSATYQSYVSCRDKVSIDNSTCTNGIDQIATCPTSRCINTFSIVNDYYREGNIATLTSDSDTRYGGACTDFTTYLMNYYDNYVKVVDDNIGNSQIDSTDNTKLAGRFNSKAETPCNTLRDYMNSDVSTLFTHVYDNLTVTENLGSIFDPDTGLFTGLDCRLLREDANEAKDSMCVLTVNRVYFSLVTAGIMAFALLFLLCCLVCFNVRHLQVKSRQLRKVVPLQDEDSTDSIKMG